MSKVSVSIQVYNVASYLWQCLDSVVNQTLRDIEIVCIGEVSADGNTEILSGNVRGQDMRIFFERFVL